MLTISPPEANTTATPSALRTCPHLEPLEQMLDEIGHQIGPGRPCPYDRELGTWHRTNAVLSKRRLERLLSDEPCLNIDDYPHPYTDTGDVTVYCPTCRLAIVCPWPTMCG